MKKFEVLWPWDNLDCLGLKINGDYKGDIFIKPYFGLYLNDGITRRRYALWPKPRLVAIEVLDTERAIRIFRRTMKPYAICDTFMEQFPQVKCFSYPFVDEYGGVSVMARTTFDDPLSLRRIRCIRLRPIQYYPHNNGVPAESY